MTLTALADLLLGLVVIALICVRQLRWTAVRPARMWRVPIVLGVVGAFSLLNSGGRTLSATDYALLLVDAAVALGTGAATGRVTVFRPLPAGALPALRAGEPAPVLQCRTGWIGVALWALVILARVGVGVAGHELGAAAAASTGVVLLTIALNRAARTAVVLARVGSAPAALARR